MRQSKTLDFVADTLWSATETATNVARWLATDGVRFIFLPIHYASGHFALVLLNCAEKRCIYLDSAEQGNLSSYLIDIKLFAAFTSTKRSQVEGLLAAWNITYEFEQQTVRTQKNAFDCGLHVVSFVHSAVTTDGKSFDIMLERETVFNVIFASLTQVRNRNQHTN